MPSFEEGLAALRRVSAALAEQRATGSSEVPSREQLTGATFTPGERVLDTVTGQEGSVVHTEFVLQRDPAPGHHGG